MSCWPPTVEGNREALGVKRLVHKNRFSYEVAQVDKKLGRQDVDEIKILKKVFSEGGQS